MQSTVRSPMLRMLYPQKTDCVFEWLSVLLNEEDSEEYENIRTYFDEYLAYSEEHMYLLEFYYKNSVRAIRNLKTRKMSIEELNELFDVYITALSELMASQDHKGIEESMREFFAACYKQKTA